jgi:Phosphatidate cytidylyltransferase, mitochondrial
MSYIHEFINTLPPSTFCFTYGSSYLSAFNVQTPKTQIDLVICVEDPLLWHTANIQSNPSHYPYHVRALGPSFIVNSVNKAAGIHYNPYIKHLDLTYKYGVISKQDLIDDLKHWKSFYVAGRMHKPISIIKENTEIQQLMHNNFKMALIVAGMMIPSLFTEFELYQQITSLSYYGDNRLENPKKVENLVSDNIKKFQKLYNPLVPEIPGLSLDNGVFERSPKYFRNIKSLPEWISQYPDLGDIDCDQRKDILISLFSSLNSKTSKQQIIHAIKTTSITKIFKYSLAKFLKSIK